MGQSSGTIRPESGLLIAGRYELQHELGRGGMGAVWLASDRAEQLSVAIKFQSAELGGVNDRRFAREADALCRLTCPHVVRFYYAGRERGLSFIVMEHLLGHTLRRRLEVCGQLYPPEVSGLVWQAAIGLGSAHRAGIVHRDVKPSNLFMTVEAGKDCLKVIDFGIAKGRDLDNTTSGSGAIGSPGYMSPEQVLGERVDHRSDCWSLAVVAFTALCGKEPFTTKSVPATMERIARGEARQITHERPDLPAALEAFFARAFVRDPEHRFQSPAEVAVHFERACQGVALESLGRLSKTKSLPAIPAHRLAGGHSPSPSSHPPRPLAPSPASGRPAPSSPPARAQRSYSPLPASRPPATAASYSSPPAPAPSWLAGSSPPAGRSSPPRDSAPALDRSFPSDDLPVVLPMEGLRLKWVLLAAAGLVIMGTLVVAWSTWRSAEPAAPAALSREPSVPSAPAALETAARIPPLASAPPLAPAPPVDPASPVQAASPPPSPRRPAPTPATKAPGDN
ncbi:MAG TPA: protein kinase [Polyangiaceae bacterium]